ncbi:MAG: hypothetical protein GEU79_19510, partial [Acidimicrobiia bacterium]|nr:hypothetical protein [Acidimicrobiia bacterium]
AANINTPDAINEAIEAGAHGSGLVRTEFLFQDRQQPPSADEQADAYRSILERFPNDMVVFRTLDIGADKSVPFLEQREEQNPALGVRGLRLGFHTPELLDTQLRAVARVAGVGRMAVMFPMVSIVEEFVRARTRFVELAAAEDADVSSVEVGTMIEVPSAALSATEIAAEADFLSIGTNDLLQYVYAADRTVGEVASLPDLLRPEMLRLLSSIVTAAHDSGRWVGVCGEAAGDPTTALALIALGVDELSASPRRVPAVKDAIRSTDTDTLASALATALKGGGTQVFTALAIAHGTPS